MSYRLSINLGATYLAWCLLDLDSAGNICGLRDMGLRAFSDGCEPRTKEPLARGRREARQLRRRRDRFKSRQWRLMDFMIEHGLMPDDEAARKELERKDPYQLRARALDEKLSLHELGRALFHINQRRGFKSNRRTDLKTLNRGAINAGIAELHRALRSFKARTLGEYFALCHKHKEAVRARPRMIAHQARYDFFPSRAMYEQELDAILDKQRTFYFELLGTIGDELKRIILYQRPLKPEIPDRCVFEPGELRARSAYPAIQAFHILKQVNALELATSSETRLALTEAERTAIIDKLHESRAISFAGIRKLLKRGKEVKFNLEKRVRKGGLQGNATAFHLAQSARFGLRWRQLPEDRQNAVIDIILGEPDPEAAISRLITDYGLTADEAQAVLSAPLYEHYAEHSLKAIRRILPFLKSGHPYEQACEMAGYPSPSQPPHKLWERLPYYGEALPHAASRGSYAPEDKGTPEIYYGRIHDPSAHIALNQLRKLVNAVIDVHGSPAEAMVHLAPDLKLGRKQLQEWTSLQKAKESREERIDAALEQLGIVPSAQTRLQFELWEDQAKDPERRCCPFTGKRIGLDDIFSGAFEIEELLPFCRSFNDSPANKILVHRSVSPAKRSKSPYEAFGHLPEWGEILARAESLPPSKQWKFRQDAWDITKGDYDDVVGRQLNDTSYMSRIVRDYLTCVVPQRENPSRVYSVSGHLTSLLRAKWSLDDVVRATMQGKLAHILPASTARGLNAILEKDIAGVHFLHFHHAVDAFVAGCVTRALLETIASVTDSGRDGSHPLPRNFPAPFNDSEEQLSDCLERLVVSYKPDRGDARRAIHALRPYTVAQLHQHTAYGLADPRPDQKLALYVTRIPVDAFTRHADIDSVVDPIWREKMLAAVRGCKDGSGEFRESLAAFARTHGVRRLRVHMARSPETMIAIFQPRDKGDLEPKPYKHYPRGGNYAADIYCPGKGEDAGQWNLEIISNHHAHQKNFVPQWQKDHPTASRIMRLQNNDMVAYKENGVTRIARVKILLPGLVGLLDHRLAKADGQKLLRRLSAQQMQAFGLRKISVDILGRVRDPARRISNRHAA